MIEMNLLLLDRSKNDADLIRGHLKDIPNIKFNLSWINEWDEAQNMLHKPDCDLFLIEEDWGNGNSGLELLKTAREEEMDKPIIILTDKEDRDVDFAAMAEGADDYIIKSKLNDFTLERSIRYSYERYKTQKKLELRESRYRNLFNKSVDAIALVDKHCYIQECNQAMASLFSQKRTTLKSKNLRDFFTSEEEYDNFSEKLKEKGLLKRYQVKMNGTSKQKLICELTTSVLFDMDHEINGYQIIINDLTQEKKNEQRMLRAEKLGMTGRIARSIAHEVRNPLTNINLALEQLKDDIQGATETSYLEIIQRSSDRINKLISELLNSAKPNSLRLEEGSIKTLLVETLDLAIDRIKLKGIKLKTEIESSQKIKYDAASLKTALLNIIINAIEAMEEDQGELHIILNEKLKEIQIEVIDNGSGMDKETINQLFDPFFTGKTKGMGLGLTSTQNIIQQHQGNIDVESEVGEGTTFTISLPKNISS